MWRISADEQATVCKAELDVTLQEAFKLTKNAVTPSDLLLYRLNDVLRAARDSNFGDAFRQKLEVLYLSIGGMQSNMPSKDQPILLIARNFAAIIEEAVRQRNEATATVTQLRNEEKMAQWRQTTNTVSPPPPHTSRAEESWSSETPTEDQLLLEEQTEEIGGGKAAVEKSSCGVFAAFAGRTNRKEGDKEVEKCAATAPTRTLARPIASPAVSAAVASTTPAESTHQARLRSLYPNKILDFSPEAIEGRLSIYHLPNTIKQADVRKLLEPFGRIIELYLGVQAKAVYSLAKMESNAAANKAVEILDNQCYAGQACFPIRVQRLEYVSSYRGAQQHKWPRLQPVQQTKQPSLCWKNAAEIKEEAPKQQQEQQSMQQLPSLSRGWNRAVIREEAAKQQWPVGVVPEVVQQHQQQEQQSMRSSLSLSCDKTEEVKDEGSKAKQQPLILLESGKIEIEDEESEIEDEESEIEDEESEIEDQESSEQHEATQRVLSVIMQAKQVKYGDVEETRDQVADDALDAPEDDDDMSVRSLYSIVSSGVD